MRLVRERSEDGAEADHEVKEEKEEIAEVRRNLLTRSTSPLAMHSTLAELGQKLARQNLVHGLLGLGDAGKSDQQHECCINRS